MASNEIEDDPNIGSVVPGMGWSALYHAIMPPTGGDGGAESGLHIVAAMISMLRTGCVAGVDAVGAAVGEGNRVDAFTTDMPHAMLVAPTTTGAPTCAATRNVLSGSTITTLFLESLGEIEMAMFLE